MRSMAAYINAAQYLSLWEGCLEGTLLCLPKAADNTHLIFYKDNGCNRRRPLQNTQSDDGTLLVLRR